MYIIYKFKSTLWFALLLITKADLFFACAFANKECQNIFLFEIVSPLYCTVVIKDLCKKSNAKYHLVEKKAVL